MAPTADNKTPVFATFGLVIIGVILALVLGGGKGPLIGGIVAGLGIIPACYGMWVGMQQETQTTMASSVLVFFVALLAAGGMLIWGIVELVK